MKLVLLMLMVEQITAFIEDDISEIQRSNKIVFHQIINQQLFLEERIRSNGGSGIKQIPQTGQGNRPYLSESHTGVSFLGMHNHGNFENNVGLGEIEAVLNGVEFITRHNDFKLDKPHTTSAEFGATEPIIFPDVPPTVTGTVEEQIAEMKEWFKAWKDQDYSVRDYRNYFKPIMCYLEGGWFAMDYKNQKNLLQNDGHFIDSDDWNRFHEKTRFAAYSGANDKYDNFASLPTKIIDVDNYTNPKMAQWNYRIMCHPLQNDLPTNRFRPVDDLAARLAFMRTRAQHQNSNSARFSLCPVNSDACLNDAGYYVLGFEDELMGQIPGVENYQGNLEDITNRVAKNLATGGPLNAAYYHRWYETDEVGAMGLTHRHRGYSDQNIYMSMTQQSEIAGITMWDKCHYVQDVLQCPDTYTQRWTYAIPMEIIYLTPLHKWNPYNIPHRGDASSSDGQQVTNGGARNGGSDVATAYDGTNSDLFYRIPAGFFTGDEVNKQHTDSTSGSVFALDTNGQVREVYGSGIRVFLPEIADVGVLRQRYPIAPVHGEGSSVWKELNAFKDLVEEMPDYFFNKENYNQTFMLATATPTSTTKPHVHTFTLSWAQVEELIMGKYLWNIPTSTSQYLDQIAPHDEGPSHTHVLHLKYYGGSQNFVYVKCDGLSICHHTRALVKKWRAETS